MQTMMQILEKKENTRGLQIHKHASVFLNNIIEEYFKYQYNFGLNLGIFSLTYSQGELSGLIPVKS